MGNPAYKQDTGADFYPPYMIGWAMVWSGDVARFLGMAGHLRSGGVHSMPKWRDTWTIEDAAIGTFIVGLDICHQEIKGRCSIWTEMRPRDYQRRDLILTKADEDVLAKHIQINQKAEIDDFDGPLKDDIPGTGDLANIQAKNIRNCAAKCYLLTHCRAFEFSPKAKPEDAVKNCQLVSRKGPRK